jgi:uncharacterized protein YbdZ (MbtH family)
MHTRHGQAVRFVVAVSLFLLTTALVAAPRQQQAEEEEFPGEFVLKYETPRNGKLKPIASKIRSEQLFEQTVEELNDTIGLPEDLNIVFLQCGEENAFYDPNGSRILMCYELIESFRKEFEDVYEDRADADQAMFDSTLFVFHHELGHALVDLLDLPITGKEEDAVDDLATLVLLHDWEGGDTSALNAADSFYMMGEREQSDADEDDIEKLPYYDEHSFGKQRFYQIACIVYGFDPDTHSDLVGESLPKERAAGCEEEYEQKARSWERLLEGYYWAADEEEIEEESERLMGARRGFMGGSSDDDETSQYQVVRNAEGQYSIWPAGRELPVGWEAQGTTGTKEECLAAIRKAMYGE